MRLASYRKDPLNHLEHELSIEDHVQDKKEIETFKQINAITVDMPNNGCTCWCKCFMVFVSEKEIDCRRSKVLQAFAGINSIKKFLDLGLPLIKYTTEGKGSGTDLGQIDPEMKESVLFEIDLAQVKRHIQHKLRLPRLDCYPLLWCQQEKKRIKWRH